NTRNKRKSRKRAKNFWNIFRVFRLFRVFRVFLPETAMSESLNQPLERVTQRELHYASRTRLTNRRLRAGEASEAGGRSRRIERIGQQSQRGDDAERLRVGDVENLPAELQLVSLSVPQLEGLAQSRVQHEVAWQPDGREVAVAHLAGPRVAERAIRFERIGEEVRPPVNVSARTRFDVAQAHTVALRLPVGRPLDVARRPGRQAGVVAHDVGQLPYADGGV